MEDPVATFMSVTGASEPVAQGYLEISGGDSAQAIQLFFESPELQTSFTNAAASSPAAPNASSTTTTAATSSNRNRAGLGRQDSQGVVHLDSDNEDTAMGEVDDDADDEVQVRHIAHSGNSGGMAQSRATQEDEDAAMARRLQDEMYAQDPGMQDGVRAPIARTTETLVGPDYGPAVSAWGSSRLEDLLATGGQQAFRRPNRSQPSANPFHQSASSMWEDPPISAAGTSAAGATAAGATAAGAGSGVGSGSESSHRQTPPPPTVPSSTRPDTASNPVSVPSSSSRTAPASSSTSRVQRLADLFRPPYDMMSPHSWDDVRDQGKDELKWIIVNIQDMSNFHCQALNRDHWKDARIKALIREHFIFLQYDKGSPRAQQYTNLYFSAGVENQDNYPYVSVIDPRTGEQVKVWSGIPFPSAKDFHADLVQFLDRYSLAVNSKNPVAQPGNQQPTQPDINRMTEDEMLEWALKNSLGDAAATDAAGSSSSVIPDPDERTALYASSQTQLQQQPATPAAPEPVALSPFAQISSTSPHGEPAHNPATTTRIQFKHPAGRVIRRFAVTDQVRRIYEWLRATPLEGKDGVVFELKAQPGGDLLEKLDLTIEEAGLKQGTVMIEFIEDEG